MNRAAGAGGYAYVGRGRRLGGHHRHGLRRGRPLAYALGAVADDSQTDPKAMPYRVLARKYRPRDLSEVIGQDVLVRTLKNAIESGRVAQAFMLTGIRGTGKTTTARIIARALNYKDGPTAGPTDDCPLCRAIAAGHHPDVLEMDAASSSKVEEMRGLLDGVPYAPTEARYKVYIIDEVHMLSKSAFNALLKTLEEPPPHVKFIFATTEVRKVPVTVLSRCQRFDLRRVEPGVLANYYKEICAKESVEAEDEALALIARAADGSVRDGLSILDQAMAQAQGGAVTAAAVQQMLGLMDTARVLDALEAALTGDTEGALGALEDFYALGADPAAVVEDMASWVHRLSRARALAGKPGALAKDLTQAESARIGALSGRLSMPTLGRAWQILSKGLSEIAAARSARAAAEMVVLRLAYASGLPDPADLLKQMEGQGAHPPPAKGGPGGGGGGGAAAHALAAEAPPAAAPLPTTAEGIVACLRTGGQPLLAEQVYRFLRPARVEAGRIEAGLAEGAPATLPQDLAQALTRLTERRWMAILVNAGAGPTLAEAAQEAALANPVVSEVIRLFPGARIEGIRDGES